MGVVFDSSGSCTDFRENTRYKALYDLPSLLPYNTILEHPCQSPDGIGDRDLYWPLSPNNYLAWVMFS